MTLHKRLVYASWCMAQACVLALLAMVLVFILGVIGWMLGPLGSMLMEALHG